jgi:hypothetical protein
LSLNLNVRVIASSFARILPRAQATANSEDRLQKSMLLLLEQRIIADQNQVSNAHW